MPKQKAQALISDLHDRFGDDLTSPQQRELMSKLQSHIHNMDEKEPVEPGFLEALEVFITEIEDEHPRAATVVGQILETLRNIGV